MADKRELVYSLIGKESVSAAAKKADRALEDLGDEFRDTGKAADKLDKEISDTEKSLKDLAVQFANTGDDKFFKQIREGERDLRKLNKASKLIGDDFGKDMAEGVSVSFSQRIGPLLAKGPGVAYAGTAIGLAMAPTLGAALAGVVVGGAGVGGVIGGLLLVAKDPAVKAAGKALSDEVSGELEESAQVFVAPALRGIQIVRDGFKDIKPEIDSIFGDSSHFVEPLVTGAVKGAKSIIVGVADAVKKADPVINAFGRSFEVIGGAVGHAFSQLAKDADEGASAIDDLTYATENFIKVTSGIVHVTAQIKGYSDQLDVAIEKGRYWLEDMKHYKGWLDITADGFKAGSVEAEAYRAATLGTAEAADFAVLKTAGMTDAQIINADASGKFRKEAEQAAIKARELGTAHDAAARAARGEIAALTDLGTELQAQSDPMFNLIQKQHDLTAAQKGYNDAVSEHGRKSPEAEEALRKMAQAAIAVQIATGNAAGSFDGKLTPAMRTTLKAAHFTDAEIKDLETQFKNAHAAGNSFAKNYTAHATVKWEVINGATYQNGVPSFNFPARASGGPVKAGQPYLVGENGPELVTPSKNGYVHDTNKTASLMTPSAGSSWGGGGVQEIRLIIEGTGVVEGLKKEIRVLGGGNVQAYLGR